MKKYLVAIVGLLCLLLLSSCQTDAPKEAPDTEVPHTHVYQETVVPPTCIEDGYTLHQCSLCDEQYSDLTVTAPGHTYRETIQDAPCNQTQKKLLECEVCQYSYTEDLALSGTIHTYVSTVTYPDRENKGYTTHSCKNCTESYVDSYTDTVNYSVGLAYTLQSTGYYVSGMGTCKDTDVVVVNYEGKVRSGEVFDSSYQRGEPIEFALNGVIKGWTEGLQLVKVGGQITLWIPAELAYGDQQRSELIVPGSALEFKVELLDLNPKKSKK